MEPPLDAKITFSVMRRGLASLDSIQIRYKNLCQTFNLNSQQKNIQHEKYFYLKWNRSMVQNSHSVTAGSNNDLNYLSHYLMFHQEIHLIQLFQSIEL